MRGDVRPERTDEQEPPTGALVAVRWRDAYFELDPEDAKDYIVTTVGWLTGSDARWVHVAGELLPDGYRGVTHIPRSTIDGRVVRLKEEA